MAEKVTDKLAREAAAPEHGNRIIYDTDLTGFGLRITANGAKSFILNYRVSGRERRYTIGKYTGRDGAWSVAAAREEAKTLKKKIDKDQDPMAPRDDNRNARTVRDLAKLYMAEHGSQKRTSAADQDMLDRYVLPVLGSLKVPQVKHSDVKALHRKITQAGHPYRANRVLALASTMFNLARHPDQGWTDHNPTEGIKRNDEERRRRYLSPEELGRVVKALDEAKHQQSANIIRLLLLTGARRGEVLQMRWQDLDLERGIWTKPSAHVKSKVDHTVPLGPEALLVLQGIRAAAEADATWIFPNTSPKRRRRGKVVSIDPGHQESVRTFWDTITKRAGLGRWMPTLDQNGAPAVRKGKPVRMWQANCRIHDLRHTYASMLVSGGLSLPVIGALMGHTQVETTQRYAHLMDEALRRATAVAGQAYSQANGGTVVSLDKQKAGE